MKVLIISHNPITTYQSMGKTFLSLFSEFQKEELCQLYIYPTVPDVNACNSYYRITDKDVVKSYLNFGKMKQRILDYHDICESTHSIYENDDDKEFLTKYKKNSWILLLRDVAWKFSKWYSKDLQKWLDQQKPTCIFFAPGESKFIYDIAIRISKKYDIPIVTYLCDEFYFNASSKNFFEKIQLKLLKKKIKRIMGLSSHVITICDDMKNLYSDEFKIKATTIYTGANYPIESSINLKDKITGLTYMGNLAYGRMQSLVDIAKELERVNREQDENLKLFLYTRSLNEEEKRIIDTITTIEYCGFVTGNDFSNVLHSSDVLLHIESFEEKYIDKVQHSISTKIADSLASGVPLMAYGPSNIASIEYLKSNDASFIASNKDELIKILYKVHEKKERKDVVNKALTCANKNHNSSLNSNVLRNIIMLCMNN